MTKLKRPDRLRFGVPSLDELFVGRDNRHGIQIPQLSENLGSIKAPTTSLCICGPDGTGKSILGLHLAAHYVWDSWHHSGDRPHVLFLSTDLSYEKAASTWASFGLSARWRLQKPFEVPSDSPPPSADIQLIPYYPTQDGPSGSLTSVLSGADGLKVPQVSFVDLASDTAGDDWSYANRLLAMLPPVNSGGACHLLIIDAVEGLETLVGERDAFGEARSRRSRVAQIMRSAVGKSHVVFVVEEPRPGERHPEEFVADAVLRLRTSPIRLGNQAYSRRTIEAEKARGQTLIRGQHPFLIYSGRGSYYRTPAESLLGTAELWSNANPDDPPSCIADKNNRLEYCSYIQVFPSLSYLNRRGGNAAARINGNPEPSKTSTPSARSFCGFGIPHLDDMLDADNSLATMTGDPRGLAFGTVTALVGENGTHKARLAKSFLRQALGRKPRDEQVGVMIGLDDTDFAALDRDLETEGHKEHLIYRRLEIHDRPSPMLFFIVQRTIEQAKIQLARLRKTSVQNLTRKDCGNIRLVITNLTTMRAVFPDIEQDPLFLPTLTDYLRREGITTLIVATEPGNPTRGVQSDFCRELRTLVQHHLCTWHVPFFGEDKVAIAVVPPIVSDRPAVVRELRHEKQGDNVRPVAPIVGKMVVDPHFEMYTGLQEGTSPRLVPLKVRLIGHGPGFEHYRTDLDSVFRELFPGAATDEIVSGSALAEYERLRSFSYLQGDAQLDHTLVLHVDEFWTRNEHDTDYEGLANLQSYWTEKVEDEANDPYRLFRNTLGKKAANRKGFFEVISESAKEPIDRIPCTWDFGFLVLKRAAWEKVLGKTVITYYDEDESRTSDEVTVKDILECIDHAKLFHAADGRQRALARIQRRRHDDLTGMPHVTWREFLQACTVVARHAARDAAEQTFAFDVDLTAPETLSSLVLEMWASEIEISRKLRNWRVRDPIDQLFPSHRARAGKESEDKALTDLLETYWGELFRVFVLLGEVISPVQLGASFSSFATRAASPGAVASRQWYSTACPTLEACPPEQAMCPVSLPGGFSTRGDWYWAMAHGSRSRRLGYRVLDVLSSLRSNVVRLQTGLGLPVRSFIAKEEFRHVWTRLSTAQEDGTKKYLSYEQTLSLWSSQVGTADRRWLWRSRLKHYDRHARLFSKLIARALKMWSEIDQNSAANQQESSAKVRKASTASDSSVRGRNGFETYDKLLSLGRRSVEESEPAKRFRDNIVKAWQSGFRFATPSTRSADAQP